MTGADLTVSDNYTSRDILIIHTDININMTSTQMEPFRLESLEQLKTQQCYRYHDDNGRS